MLLKDFRVRKEAVQTPRRNGARGDVTDHNLPDAPRVQEPLNIGSDVLRGVQGLSGGLQVSPEPPRMSRACLFQPSRAPWPPSSCDEALRHVKQWLSAEPVGFGVLNSCDIAGDKRPVLRGPSVN